MNDLVTNSNVSVGFIGLGQMGSSMALNILSATNKLAVFDVAPSATESLVSAGATLCHSPRQLAQTCDVVFLCLPSEEIVEAVIFANEGIASAHTESLIVVDTSTLNQGIAVELSARCHEHNITFVDCPVSGLPQRAKNGTLTAMFGGDKDTYNHVVDIIRCFSTDPIYCGEIGTGQAMKTINNIIYNINIAALCEVLPFAVANGLDHNALEQLTATASCSSFASRHFVPKMLRREFTGDFTLSDAYKDIVNLNQMADKVDADLPITSAMIKCYELAMNAGFQNEAKSAMLKVSEERLGIQFRHIKPGD